MGFQPARVLTTPDALESRIPRNVIIKSLVCVVGLVIVPPAAALDV
jgi:hypothetical protein